MNVTKHQSGSKQSSAHAILEAIDRSREELLTLGAQAERDRAPSQSLVTIFKQLGIYRAFVPARLGGYELSLPDGLKIMQTLSQLDSSVGWLAMIAMGSSLILSSLDPMTYAEFSALGQDVPTAGSAQALGYARRDGAHWRVHGRWPFASGCNAADWLLGACVMHDEHSKKLLASDGKPVVRVVILPRDRWIIEDTWYVMGMKGTGSHHISLEESIVDDRYFLEMGTATENDGPYGAVPHLIALMHGAVHVGIARAALNDTVGAFSAVAPRLIPESVLGQLGRIDANVVAAECVLFERARKHWALAVDGQLKANEHLIAGMQTVLYVAETCLEVVNNCFELGGSSAVFNQSPLQRHLSDLLVATQHGVVQRHHYSKAGRALIDNGNAESLALNALFS